MKNNWEETTLEEVCEILDSKRIPITASKREKGKYPYYGANGIQDYVSNYIFDDELVLLAEDGGNFGSKEKPIAYRVSGKCWVNNHAHVLKPKTKALDIDFLCYSLMFYDVSNIVNGAILPKLTQSSMRKMSLYLPPLQEQKQIVEKLDKAFANIDKLTEIAKQNLENSKELFSSYLNKFFGKFDKEINKKDWKEFFLEDLVEDITSSKRIYKKEYVKKGIPFYRTKEIKELANKKQISVELFISKEKYQEIKNKYGVPQEQDLLISAVGTIGEMYIVKKDDEFYFKDGNILWFKKNKNIIDIYLLKYILSAYLFQIHDITNGTAYNALTIEKLKKYKILIPINMQQQKQIVKILDNLQEKTKKLEEIYNKKIELAKELKQSILHKALQP